MSANNEWAALAKRYGQNSGTQYTTTSASSSQSSQPSGFFSTLSSVLLRTTLIILVVLIVLIFIHFTFYPIFKTKPDSPGIIPTPSFTSDDKVFWRKKQDVSKLDVRTTPIGSSSGSDSYALTLDVQIDDAHAYTNLPRIIFYKGNDLVPIQKGREAQATVGNMIVDGSLVFALTRDTNDLQVSVITAQNNIEGVLLYNVPLRKPFRIGIIISDKRLEVYTNGLLSRTRALSGPPKPIVGYFWPSPTSGIQLRNLHIWPQAITPGEMRAALPALNAGDFDVSNLSETANCSAVTSIANSLTTLLPDFNATNKPK